MGSFRQRFGFTVACLGIACASSGARRFYVASELSTQDGLEGLTIAPGPWPEIPAVLTQSALVPDDLVIPTLQALLELPGAVDACDANTGRPRPEASEYCVALYRTPSDWRVSWPVRNTLQRGSRQEPSGLWLRAQPSLRIRPEQSGPAHLAHGQVGRCMGDGRLWHDVGWTARA